MIEIDHAKEGVLMLLAARQDRDLLSKKNDAFRRDNQDSYIGAAMLIKLLTSDQIESHRLNLQAPFDDESKEANMYCCLNENSVNVAIAILAAANHIHRRGGAPGAYAITDIGIDLLKSMKSRPIESKRPLVSPDRLFESGELEMDEPPVILPIDSANESSARKRPFMGRGGIGSSKKGREVS